MSDNYPKCFVTAKGMSDAFNQCVKKHREEDKLKRDALMSRVNENDLIEGDLLREIETEIAKHKIKIL